MKWFDRRRRVRYQKKTIDELGHQELPSAQTLRGG